jgi:hypothetical protein
MECIIRDDAYQAVTVSLRSKQLQILILDRFCNLHSNFFLV